MPVCREPNARPGVNGHPGTFPRRAATWCRARERNPPSPPFAAAGDGQVAERPAGPGRDPGAKLRAPPRVARLAEDLVGSAPRRAPPRRAAPTADTAEQRHPAARVRGCPAPSKRQLLARAPWRPWRPTITPPRLAHPRSSIMKAAPGPHRRSFARPVLAETHYRKPLLRGDRCCRRRPVPPDPRAAGSRRGEVRGTPPGVPRPLHRRLEGAANASVRIQRSCSFIAGPAAELDLEDHFSRRPPVRASAWSNPCTAPASVLQRSSAGPCSAARISSRERRQPSFASDGGGSSLSPRRSPMCHATNRYRQPAGLRHAESRRTRRQRLSTCEVAAQPRLRVASEQQRSVAHG